MKRAQLIFLLISFLLILAVVESEPVARYTSTIAEDTKSNAQNFREQIVQLANKINEKPVEPRIDPVWKLIPGYNGIEVDIDETLKLARKHGLQKISPILREVPTQTSIWEMPPNPIYRGNPKKPFVAFMINVAWGNEYLPDILKTLEEKKVKATFFLDGTWLSKYPDLAQKILQAGHEIGNHATTHPMMSKLSKEKIIEEIETTNKRISSILNITPTLFAPPAGDFDHRVVELAWQRKMLTILWTLDTVDWRKPNYKQMANRIIDQVEPGSLILMHPTEPTALGISLMIDGIRAKGLTIAPVSQVLSSNRELPVELVEDF